MADDAVVRRAGPPGRIGGECKGLIAGAERPRPNRHIESALRLNADNHCDRNYRDAAGG
jgi:hypothetical protein